MENNKIVLSPVLETNTENVRSAFGYSSDLNIRELTVAGTKTVLITIDGMCDELKIITAVITPLTCIKDFDNGIKSTVLNCGYTGSGIKEVNSVTDICGAVIGGCAVVMFDGENTGFSFGVQGFAKKGISEPQSEQNEKGSQEGFTDNVKDNISLLRRRLRTESLVIEKTVCGRKSNTPVYMCRLSDRADEKLYADVKRRINNAKLDTVLGSGYLRPFLDGDNPSFFSGTGITERPDVLAAKIAEGRIGIIVDGTPFAVIVPYLLSDYFHEIDDYLSSPFYALFIRLLRITCLAAAITLPGIFVAVCVFHPELLPETIMFDIASEESKTPFPIMAEAITIHLIYEIVQEAGLRMPRAIGHAVSIVGALVIGDAAVTAGLIAAPMLIIVALTTVCSAVVARLHEPVAIMRLLFIIAGGTMGFYGIFIGVGLLIADICSVSPYGVPFSVPFSPFVPAAQTDNVLRAGWKKLGQKNINVKGLKF